MFIFISETFNRLCFYLCVIPYRIQKTERGIYVAETNIFQKYITTIFFLVTQPVHFVTIYNMYKRIWEGRNTYPGDHTPYFSIFYLTTLFTFSSCMMYKLVFHQKAYIRFLNSFVKNLNRHNAHAEPKNYLKITIILVLILHQLFLINFVFIGRNYIFTLKSFLQQMRVFVVLDEFSSSIQSDEHTLTNYFIVATYLVIVIMKNLQGCSCALLCTINLYGFVVLSFDFHSSCQQLSVNESLKYYRNICRLTRTHDKCFGWGLLLYLLSTIFCFTFFVLVSGYSTSFRGLGVQVYKLYWIFMYTLVFILGLAFTTKMEEIAQLLNRSDSISFNCQTLIWHFKQQQYCKVQGRVMPISYSVLYKSVIFAASIFIATMPQECAKCVCKHVFRQ